MAVVRTMSTGSIFWQVLVKDDREVIQTADQVSSAVSHGINLLWNYWQSLTCEQQKKMRFVPGELRSMVHGVLLDSLDKLLLTSEWPDWKGFSKLHNGVGRKSN